MALTPELLDELATREASYSLSRDFYNSPDVYRTDIECIWYQSWVFAGHTCELINAEDRISFQLADYHIAIARDGEQLVASATPTCQDSTTNDASTDEILAKNVHCRAVSGYIFISLADTPDDFDTFAQTITPYTSPHNPDDLKIAAETSIIEYGNWKLVFENNRECYHCLSNHPELIITYPEDPAVTGTDAESELPEMVSTHWEKCEGAGFPSVFKIADDGTYRVARMPLLEDFSSYTMDGYDAVKKLVGDFKGVNPGALVLFHYPSTWNHFLEDQVISFRVTPIGPQASLVTTKWLIHKDAVEGVDYDKNNLTHVWDHTNAQDKQLVEENQRGINSPLYESGPYSSVYETGVIQFVDWYSTLLQQRLVQTEAEVEA